MALQVGSSFFSQHLTKLRFSLLRMSLCFLSNGYKTHNHALYSSRSCMRKCRGGTSVRFEKLLTSLGGYNSNVSMFTVHTGQQKRCFIVNVQGHFLSRKLPTNLICIRQSHTGSRFLQSNPLFTEFMKILLEEYAQLCQEQNTQVLEDSKALRLQFLRPVVAVLKKTQAKEEEKTELAKLLKEDDDEEMKALLAKEMEQLDEDILRIEEELINALVGEEAADSNDIVLEVSAGVGGQEAMLFGAEVFEMYCNYALYKGWSVSQLVQDESEMGGSRKASVEISGEDVYRHLKHEAGVHRVQRVPKTEKSGRMHTSTITVSVVPKPREIDIVLDPKDLKVETMRGSGPGGQSVNTTDSAVRVTHLPTGTSAECRQERSQIKNKNIAMEKLRLKMYQTKLDDQEAKRKATRKMQMGTRGRSEKIRTYNFQQDRISDHRLKGNINNLQEFMRGGEELDNLIFNLEVEEKHSSVQSMLDEFESTLKQKSKKS